MAGVQRVRSFVDQTPRVAFGRFPVIRYRESGKHRCHDYLLLTSSFGAQCFAVRMSNQSQ